VTSTYITRVAKHGVRSAHELRLNTRHAGLERKETVEAATTMGKHRRTFGATEVVMAKTRDTQGKEDD
jgi:hypothetical protein